MRVELIYWPECPSHGRATEMLTDAMRTLDLDPASIEATAINTPEEARALRFVGSPTIRVDGVDIQPPPVDQHFSLTCRLYRRRDGRPSPTPDPQDILDALSAAIGHNQELGANK
jgi:hypothetical protein